MTDDTAGSQPEVEDLELSEDQGEQVAGGKDDYLIPLQGIQGESADTRSTPKIETDSF